MTAPTRETTLKGTVPRSTLDPAAAPLWQCAALVAALVPVTLLALPVEERVLNGINLWIKPLKFQLAGLLHVATLAVLVLLIDPKVRAWLSTRLVCWAVALCTFGEVAYIALQAGRGRHSHFNLQTPLEAMLYSVMGIGAVTMILGAAVIGALILARPRDGLGQGLRWGAGLGLILGFAATLIVAGYLGNNGGHWVGVPSQGDVQGLPVVGWSTEVGDLRVPHFFALHMMQALPILGWLIDRYRPAIALPSVAAASLAGIAVTAATFAQALAGKPFLG